MPHRLIEELIETNRLQSAAFVREHDARLAYRKEHPTEIGALKCMDVGGQFDLRQDNLLLR